jgi:glycine/D-amino acid oxidase-like deaminating enzyme
MQSYWELDSWSEADIAIVGAGLVGISTAIEYLERNPGKRVIVLERGLTPQGASIRNAGFACFGSLSEIAADIDLMGASAACEIVQQRVEGLMRLKARCKGADIGYRDDGGHEIFLADHPALQRMEEVNYCIERLFGSDVFIDRTDLIQEHGLSDLVQRLIRTPYEATIDSGKLVRTLWLIATCYGAEIRTGAEVININDHGSGVEIAVRTMTQDVVVKVEQVVVAANAWIPGLVHSNAVPEIRPGRGQVLITNPIENLQLRGSFHADEGFYYFRNVGNRVLLGGGRNIDFEGEATLSHETTVPIQTALETMLRDVIVPYHANVVVEHRWAGTMAFTPSKQPFVGRISPGVIVAFGCNGMGVALSSSIATSASAILG